MSFESGSHSFDTVKEIQLPDDILELCKQLRIPDEKMSQLAKLDKATREDIYAAIFATKETLNNISQWENNGYISLFSGNSSQA